MWECVNEEWGEWVNEGMGENGERVECRNGGWANVVWGNELVHSNDKDYEVLVGWSTPRNTITRTL